MKIKMYSVFDKSAGSYSTPFFAPNDEVAKRNFRYSLKRLDDFFVCDLVLYFLCDFDVETASFSNFDSYIFDSGFDVLQEREIEEKNSEVKK